MEDFNCSRRLGSSFGVEVIFTEKEVDLIKLSNEIRKFISASKLIVIRNLELDDDKLYQLSKLLGNPIKYPFSKGSEKYPELVEIRKLSTQEKAMSTMWHSDTTYIQEPPHLTMLYGVEIPPYGGNTLFSDTAAAFNDLSEPLKCFLRSQLIVCRSDLHKGNERLSNVSNPNAEECKPLEASQPAIFLHPETKVESVYIGQEHASHFHGMTQKESYPIISYLTDHISNDKYTVSINWSKNSLIIFDNRTTQHRAIDNYHGFSRTLKRIVIREDRA